jgi:peptide/nickel transport system substrate-binding protein
MKAAGSVEAFAKKPVGTGPYKFVEYVKDDHLTLEAHAGYWGGAPKIERTIFRPIAETATKIAALRAGEIDLVDNVPPQAMAEIESDPNLRIQRVPGVRNIFIGINAYEGPLKDKRVRQALNYAVDKESIIKNILSDQATIVAAPGGPSINGFDPTLKPYPFDIEKAKQLLAEAGFPNGIDIDFASPQGRYTQDKEIATTIAGTLAKAGIRTNLQVLDWNTFYPDFLAKKHKGLWLFGLVNGLMDEDHYNSLYFHSAGRGYYGNPELDAEIAKEQSILDPEQRRQALVKILNTVYNDPPWIFLYNQMNVYGVNKRLKWQARADEDIAIWDATVE